MTDRTIHRSAASPSREIAECLQSLLVSELLKPGSRLLVISPWMSDFPALDNTGGRFGALDPSWTAAWVPFSAVLGTLLRQGVNVRVACGPGDREGEFVQRLEHRAAADGTQTRLLIRQTDRSHQIFDHEKAIVADAWAMFGSMNLTYRGVTLNGELVTVSTDLSRVAKLATELSGLFG
jgi:phosphatidylserine/phosphatidylglycerophosphate/cardiolipin synthase-like enzyme